MLMKDIVDWLAPLVGAQIGTNLFPGFIPQTVNPLKGTIVLARVPGLSETDGSSVRRKPVQFFSFAQTYPEAEEEAYRYYNALVHHGSVELGSGTILSIVGPEPYYLGVGERDRHEFTCNLMFNYKAGG